MLTGTRAGTQYTRQVTQPPRARDNDYGGGEPEGPGGGDEPPLIPRPPAAMFSLTPGRANPGILDYTTKTGYYHWSGATAKLEEELYDCSPNGFYQFIKSLTKRADSYGWSKPGGITWLKPNDNDNQPRNLLVDYGVFTLEAIRIHEESYIATQTREAQDDRMLFECIMNSLTIEGKAKLNIFETEYHVSVPNQAPLPSGLLLFKVLVRESHLDSNATSGMIRTKLTNLDSHLEQMGNDIVKFNGYVTMLLDSLKARGETTHDLLTNLFKAYAACSDKNFVRYIADRQTEWEDGKEMTPTQLMEKAANKYKILKTKELWEAPSAEEEKLLALEARFAELKKKFANKRKKPGSSNNSSGSNGDPPTQKKKKDRKEKPAWMFTRPTDADLRKPREWNGTMWHYCGSETGGKCDGVYRAHKPSECKGTAKKGNKSKSKREDLNKKVTIKESIEEITGGYVSE